jgi:hypothetical protein
VLTTLAGGAVQDLVADDLTSLHGDSLELLLHPSDLVISGRELDAARARGILARELTYTPAYMTWDKEAMELEDRLRDVRRVLRTHADGRADPDALTYAEARLVETRRAIEDAKFPFDEWEVLFREQLLLERDLLRAAQSAAPSGPEHMPQRFRVGLSPLAETGIVARAAIPPADRPIPTLLGDLRRQAVALFGGETTLLGAELRTALAGLAKGAGLAGAAGPLAYAGLLAAVAGLSLMLAGIIPWWAATLLVGVAVAAGGYLLVRSGMAALSRLDLLPRRTLRTLSRLSRNGQRPAGRRAA